MKCIVHTTLALLAVLAIAVHATAMPASTPASAQVTQRAPSTKRTPTFHVFGPREKPLGKAYRQLSADWWTWALTIPNASSPLRDWTGRNCAQGQPSKGVWYLAGEFGSDVYGPPVTRACTIPHGRTLFFPVLNYFEENFYCSWLPNNNCGWETDDVQRLAGGYAYLEQLTSWYPAALATQHMVVEIDGTQITQLTPYITKSVDFTWQVPALDPVYGVPNAVSRHTIDRGVYLAIDKLSPGRHHLHIVGQWHNGNNLTDIAYTLDVTYNLCVLGKGKHKPACAKHA